MKPLIYAVEDDGALAELYTFTLESEFNCFCFEEGTGFFEAVSKTLPDLIILDIMLPGEDGFEILSNLKSDKTTSHIPVIMVSAKGEELSKVKGLNMGADDYIAKPFGILEFVARIKANLRKRSSNGEELLTHKNIVIDFSKRQALVDGKHIQTTLKEFSLLSLLCKNAGKVQERENIFNEVWGYSFAGETRTLDIHIKELRKKLSEAGSEAIIQTVRGVGYILL